MGGLRTPRRAPFRRDRCPACRGVLRRPFARQPVAIRAESPDRRHGCRARSRGDRRVESVPRAMPKNDLHAVQGRDRRLLAPPTPLRNGAGDPGLWWHRARVSCTPAHAAPGNLPHHDRSDGPHPVCIGRRELAGRSARSTHSALPRMVRKAEGGSVRTATRRQLAIPKACLRRHDRPLPRNSRPMVRSRCGGGSTLARAVSSSGCGATVPWGIGSMTR